MKLILNSLSDTEAFAQKMADRLKGKTMTITSRWRSRGRKNSLDTLFWQSVRG